MLLSLVLLRHPVKQNKFFLKNEGIDAIINGNSFQPQNPFYGWTHRKIRVLSFPAESTINEVNVQYFLVCSYYIWSNDLSVLPFFFFSKNQIRQFTFIVYAKSLVFFMIPWQHKKALLSFRLIRFYNIFCEKHKICFAYSQPFILCHLIMLNDVQRIHNIYYVGWW